VSTLGSIDYQAAVAVSIIGTLSHHYRKKIVAINCDKASLLGAIVVK